MSTGSLDVVGHLDFMEVLTFELSLKKEYKLESGVGEVKRSIMRSICFEQSTDMIRCEF